MGLSYAALDTVGVMIWAAAVFGSILAWSR